MKKPPIFIVGCIRSGTTLLKSILNAHENIVIPRETNYFRILENYNDDNISASKSPLNFWKFYKEESRFKYLQLDDREVFNRLNGKENITPKTIFDSVMEENCNKFDKVRWGDKTPGHEKYLEQILTWYPTAKIVFMIRDPLAVVASQKKLPWGSSSLTIFLRRWRKSINYLFKYKNNHIKIVKYEDLVTKTEKIVKDICDYVDEEYSIKMIQERTIENYSRKEADKWFYKHEKKAASTITDEGIYKWKTVLNEYEKYITQYYTANYLRGLNYANNSKNYIYAYQLRFYWSTFKHYSFSYVRKRLANTNKTSKLILKSIRRNINKFLKAFL